MDPVLIFLLGFATVFIVGIAGEIVFERTGVPDVVWLMIVGLLLLGPVLGVVHRADLLAIGPYIGAITIVVVLFEGGSKLRLSEVSRALPRSSLLALSGFVLSVGVLAAASMGAAAMGILPAQWTWLHGIILGAILGGSSSVVIMPALAKANLDPKIGSLVSVESALSDVLCVVVTIACIDIAVSGSADPIVAATILGKSFGIGLGVGLVVGMLWLLFLRALKDSPHAYAATLSILLVLAVVVQLLQGNAALAILAAAVVVGNAPALAASVGLQPDARLSAGVQDAHVQITFIVKSFFFTFIGAMIGPPWDLVGIGVAFALLLFVARIPAVLLSTARSGMSGADRRIVTVMLPRGMAAGVLAMMPFAAGMPGTEQLAVVVFACVLFTILLFAIGLPIARRGLRPTKAAPEAEAGPVPPGPEPSPPPRHRRPPPSAIRRDRRRQRECRTRRRCDLTGGANATPHEPEAPVEPTAQRFGTFAGVFTPTLLTILGVIMYLRLPWVVGNAGLLGSWLILALAFGITAATGLSLSSIATNTRLGAGGPYAIIARSLGLEVGGSVGVPLYVSQALAVAMYVFGFREGYHWIFPEHPALLVDVGMFFVIFTLALWSTSLAFRIQFVVMAVIVVSLGLVLGNVSVFRSGHIQWWGSYPGSAETGFSGSSFWLVFAVFFPAATGVMAGANMSGDLKSPRRSIPVGTLSAIAISAVVYFALTFWSSYAATPEDLAGNYTVMIDKSLWAPGVLAGLLGATFSSALSSLIGAPRILLALGRDRLIPGATWFSKVGADGEPRRALFVTGALVLAALLLRDLNVIAPLITMFFLITYAVINLVTLVESSLGLMSFRPTMKLPRIVPLFGTVGCTFAMFIVNPTFSLVAWGVVIAIYVWILKRGVDRPVDDVRSGLFVAFAEWAASRVTALNMETARGWKPNLLVPVSDPAELRGEFRLLVDLVKPEGSIKLLGLADDETVDDVTRRITRLGQAFRERHVFTTWSVVDTAGYTKGIVTGLQALGSAFFRPNLLALTISHDVGRDVELGAVVQEARRLRVGLALIGMHAQAATGRERVINLWVRAPSLPTSVEAGLTDSNMHLAVLLAFRLSRAWKSQLNLICAVPEAGQIAATELYLRDVRELCRLPHHGEILVLEGDLFRAMTERAPQSDIDVISLPVGDEVPAFVRLAIAASRSSCIFTQDSGAESALA